MTSDSHRRIKGLSKIIVGWFVLAVPVIEAGTWETKPQPLVAGSAYREAVKAEPGSNLAFDSASRILWTVAPGGFLAGFIWEQDGVFNPVGIPSVEVLKGSALVVDPAWHSVYFVSKAGQLKVAKREQGAWGVGDTVAGSFTQVLGVHPDWHTVFAYDEARRVLLAVYWTGTEWASQIVMSDVGKVDAQGVIDSRRHILYFTAANAPSLDVPAQVAPRILEQWPLIAAWWNGTNWQSQVIARTGLAQRPAYNAKDATVYYTHRADTDGLLRSFSPATGTLVPGDPQSIPNLTTTGSFPKSRPAVFGTRSRWHGAPTWVDDQRYPFPTTPINYFSSGSTSSSFYSLSGAWDWGFHAVGYPPFEYLSTETNGKFEFLRAYIPVPPIRRYEQRSVDAWTPNWVTETAPAGLRAFRALYSAGRGELVQERVWEGAWSRTLASVWTKGTGFYTARATPSYTTVPNSSYQRSVTPVYQLGPGVTTTLRPRYILRETTADLPAWEKPIVLQTFPSSEAQKPFKVRSANGEEIFYSSVSDPSYGLVSYGLASDVVIGGNPPPTRTFVWDEVPAPIPQIIEVDGVPFYDPTSSEVVTTVAPSARTSITSVFGDDVVESAEMPAAWLRSETLGTARVQTFGHPVRNAAPRVPRPGARYLNYSVEKNALAAAGGIAGDDASRVLFYVQPPQLDGGPSWVVLVW